LSYIKTHDSDSYSKLSFQNAFFLTCFVSQLSIPVIRRKTLIEPKFSEASVYVRLAPGLCGPGASRASWERARGGVNLLISW
jgi:hypothetical protein